MFIVTMLAVFPNTFDKRYMENKSENHSGTYNHLNIETIEFRLFLMSIIPDEDPP